MQNFQLQVYNAITNIPIEPAIETPSQNFTSEQQYALVVYVKTTEWMYLLERTIGMEKVDSCFQHYFDLWKNKHPQPDDMKAAFEEVIHGHLTDFFGKLHTEGQL